MQTIGVVLAGGRSSRMGTDKALLTINEINMIDRAKALLEQTSVAKIVVSRNDNNNNHLADIIENRGPLSGIHSVATRFPLHNLLILPVDLPLMDAEVLQSIIDVGVAAQSNARIENANLPLYINNSAKIRQVLDYTLKCTKNFSIAGLCSQFPIQEVVVSSSSYLYNTNTPEQWRFAMQHVDIHLPINQTEIVYESI